MMAQDVDPFFNNLHLSPLFYVRSALCGLLLVPLRVFLLVLALLFSWMTAHLASLGMAECDLTSPLPGWRQVARRWWYRTVYFWYWAMGFRVRIVGERVERSRAPILIVAPHTSFLDTGVVALCQASPVARIENKNTPMIGVFQFLGQTVHVDRRDQHSREKALQVIHDRATADGDWPQLFICPEGTNTNGRALIQFKRGGFTPGLSVQPVVITYPGNNPPRDLTTWTWNMKHGIRRQIWLLLANPVNHIQVEFLPVYDPSQEEKADPNLFAKNVQILMALHLRVLATDITKDKFFKSKKAD